MITILSIMYFSYAMIAGAVYGANLMMDNILEEKNFKNEHQRIIAAIVVGPLGILFYIIYSILKSAKPYWDRIGEL